jgi:hypothetical protein
MTFFKKWDPRQKVYLPSGSWFQFEDLGNGFGVLATDDGYTIEQLRECIKNQRGGVEEVSQAEFDEVKKKVPINSFGMNSREALDMKQMSALFKRLSDGAAADGDKFHSDVGYRASDIAKPAGKTGFRPRVAARV